MNHFYQISIQRHKFKRGKDRCKPRNMHGYSEMPNVVLGEYPDIFAYYNLLNYKSSLTTEV